MTLSHLQCFDEICWIDFQFCNSLMKKVDRLLIFFEFRKFAFTSITLSVKEPMFQQVRVRPQSDDLRKMRIRTRRTVSFNVLL